MSSIKENDENIKNNSDKNLVDISKKEEFIINVNDALIKKKIKSDKNINIINKEVTNKTNKSN